jgi:hypothetical protein
LDEGLVGTSRRPRICRQARKTDQILEISCAD